MHTRQGWKSQTQMRGKNTSSNRYKKGGQKQKSKQPTQGGPVAWTASLAIFNDCAGSDLHCCPYKPTEAEFSGQQLFLKMLLQKENAQGPTNGKKLRGQQLAKSSGANKWQKAQGPKNGKSRKSKENGTRPSKPPANAEKATASSDTGAAIYRGNWWSNG